jgi:hypothetical protein
MAFQNSGQTGSQPVAATQLAQEYVVDTSDANYLDTIPIILTRGAPRILVLATQTGGAVAGEIQVQASVANQTGVGSTERRFVDVGTPVLTPLNVPIVVERAVPTKFLRVLVSPQDALNNVTVRVTVMAAQ